MGLKVHRKMCITAQFSVQGDHLFIEAAFLGKNRNIAEKKCYLMAWQAGKIQVNDFTSSTKRT